MAYGWQRYIRLAIVFLLFGLVILIYASTQVRSVQAEVDSYAFLKILALPWRCQVGEPREATDDWDDHWARGGAVGMAIDFNAWGGRDADLNTTVLSPLRGLAYYRYDPETGYGNYVDIDAGNGWVVRIAHLGDRMETDGYAVKGQPIGRVGDHSGGPHIHIELILNGGAPDVDQVSWLFGHPIDELRSGQGYRLYSNNCGTGPATILYEHAWYGGDAAYFFGSGIFNVPLWFNDRASSLSIRPEWAATLFEHNTGDSRWLTGGRKLFSWGIEPDFSDDTFDNGVGVNDNVSALWVFNQRPIPGDVEPSGVPRRGDGDVDVNDFAVLIGKYGWRGTPGTLSADIDDDGDVDEFDYNILADNFGVSLPLSDVSVSTVTNTSPAPLAVPNPPSNASFTYETNSIGTAVVLTLHWEDNADNEDGFQLIWNVAGHGGSTYNTLGNPPQGTTLRPDTTSTYITVIPCGTTSRSATVSASLSAFNAEGTSNATSSAATVMVPACPPVYLPAVFRNYALITPPP